MRVLDEHARVRDAIQDWINSYGLTATYGADKRGRQIGKELLALNQATATADEVAEIIGNDSWSGKLSCGECGTKTWDIIEIGERPDYESATAYLCSDCLRKALVLLKGAKNA